MVHFRFSLLLAALCASCSYGALVPTTSETILIPVPGPSSVTPDITALASDITPSPSIAPTSTVTSTTTIVTKTTPHTTASPTTTTPTTTTPTTTTPTTTTSTTTPTPPPTPAPTPVPLKQGNWSFVENNKTCIVVQFAATLNVSYTKNVTGNESSTAYANFNVPADAVVLGGRCADNDQYITLAWPKDVKDNMMNLTYHKNLTTMMYSLKRVDLVLSSDNFVNASTNASVELHHGAEWSTPLATSYRCMAPTRLNMTSNTSAASLTFSSLQEQAFRTSNDTQFSAARECGGSDVPDAVPIAVGCALGGLVVVVLIAYLVGRRRSSARGYLSM